VVLVHLVQGAWLLVQAREAEVALLEDVGLVNLGDRLVGLLPSLVHDLGIVVGKL
jgi:hypothetical protein